MSDFAEQWSALGRPFQRCLELAHDSLRGGGLAVGAVLSDFTRSIVAEGRNRAYDAPGGDDPLQGTPIAHAEMNALARVATAQELRDCVLWSSQEPCPMCAAAARFIGVGRVVHIAPDPSWLAAHAGEPSSSLAAAAAHADHPVADVWVVAANTLFLWSTGRRAGAQHRTIERMQAIEPETAAVALRLLEDADADAALAAGETVDQFFAARWDELSAAGEGRRLRRDGRG